VNASINPAASPIAAQPIPSAAVSKFFALKPRLFINGEWVESRSGKTVQVFDPATGKQVGLVADAGPEDVDRAVAAARAALEAGPWADMTPSGREALLWKLADLIERDAAEFAEIESIDNGKTRFMASIVDVPGARNYFRYMAGWATKITGTTMQAGTVWVNCHNLVDPNMPFGGYKQSGSGREHGRVAVEMYTETKSVCIMI
jgi:phenylacetaldehyde dehydrogenase